ncbi:hypothetical protein [Alloactinosynnema sp. L-07]|nr:hypothetical protein [Alloactinosynnema sp. L-07]
MVQRRESARVGVHGPSRWLQASTTRRDQSVRRTPGPLRTTCFARVGPYRRNRAVRSTRRTRGSTRHDRSATVERSRAGPWRGVPATALGQRARPHLGRRARGSSPAAPPQRADTPHGHRFGPVRPRGPRRPSDRGHRHRAGKRRRPPPRRAGTSPVDRPSNRTGSPRRAGRAGR